MNDGEWHDVRFLAKENFAMLTIDGDESSAVKTNALIHITTGGLYHFGGQPCNLNTISRHELTAEWKMSVCIALEKLN